MSNPGYKRSERINEVVFEAVSRLLLREVKDPRVEGVTLTHVEVSDDLSHANVFYRILSIEEEPDKATLKEVGLGLRKVSGFLRRSLGKELHMKKIPELHFKYDFDLDRQSRLEGLLHEVRSEWEATP